MLISTGLINIRMISDNVAINSRNKLIPSPHCVHVESNMCHNSRSRELMNIDKVSTCRTFCPHYGDT